MSYTQNLLWILIGIIFTSSTILGQEDPVIKDVVKANWKVGLKIYNKLVQENPTKSTFFSPYSLTSSLFALFLGSKSETAQQIQQFMGLSTADMSEKYHLTQAKLYANVKDNSAAYEKLYVSKRFFYDQSLTAKPTFLNQLQSYYQISAQPIDFKNPTGAQGVVNKYVADGTGNFIDTIVPAGEFKPDTRFISVSGIYFQGKWQYGFDPSFTKPAPFTTIDGSSKTWPFMEANGQFNYYAAPQFGASILELSYQTEHYAVYVILPDATGSLASWEASYLTTDNLKAMVAAMKPSYLKVHFPKFETDTHYELSSEFKDLGLKEPFNPATADFEGIFTDATKVALDDYFNEAHVVFGETGADTKPAAGTGTPTNFQANRPFMYAIICKHTKAPFFMGRFTGY